MGNFFLLDFLGFAVGNFLISSLWGFFTTNLDVNLTKMDKVKIGDWLQPVVALHLWSKHWFRKQVGVLSNGDPLGVLLFGAKQSGGMCISTSRSSDRLVL